MRKGDVVERENIKNRVLDLIKERDGISRIDIAREFGVTPAGIGKIINEFLEKGIVKEARIGESTGGRRPLMLVINKEKIGLILGIYCAPKFIQISVGTIDGDIFSTSKYPIEDLKDELIENIEKIAEKEIKNNPEIKIISVVTNGLVDSKMGVSIFSPHYNTKNVPLKQIFEKRFKLKTFVENDVRAMALTEKSFGSCKKNHNFVVLNVEDGVGGSIYLNDMLYRGYGSMSGELGHMIVKRNSLEKCSCGKRGCLETEVSNRAIIRKIVSQIKINNQYSVLKKDLEEKKVIKIGDVLRAVEEKDLLSLNIVGEALQYIAYAIDMIISVINPEKIVLYGEIFKSEYIFKLLMNDLNKLTLDEQNYELKISDYLESIYEKAPFSLVNYMIFKK